MQRIQRSVDALVMNEQSVVLPSSRRHVLTLLSRKTKVSQVTTLLENVRVFIGKLATLYSSNFAFWTLVTSQQRNIAKNGVQTPWTQTSASLVDPNRLWSYGRFGKTCSFQKMFVRFPNLKQRYKLN